MDDQSHIPSLKNTLVKINNISSNLLEHLEKEEIVLDEIQNKIDLRQSYIDVLVTSMHMEWINSTEVNVDSRMTTLLNEYEELNTKIRNHLTDLANKQEVKLLKAVKSKKAEKDYNSLRKGFYGF